MGRIDAIKENSNSFLTFSLGKEFFAVHVAHINQIIEVGEIFELPNVAGYVKGILNQQGRVLPVVDTRVKFKLAPIEITPLTNILVMEFGVGDEILPVGALVDGVHEVVEIKSEQIMPPPSINGAQEVKMYIDGIVNLNDKFTMLLNVNKFFQLDELDQFPASAVTISKVNNQNHN